MYFFALIIFFKTRNSAETRKSCMPALSYHKTFSDNGDMLASRWIRHFFQKGYSEVRILFDQVDSQGVSSKLIERNRRDGEIQTEYEPYEEIHNNTKLPGSKWMTFLKNRQNKRLYSYLLFGTVLLP